MDSTAGCEGHHKRARQQKRTQLGIDQNAEPDAHSFAKSISEALVGSLAPYEAEESDE